MTRPPAPLDDPVEPDRLGLTGSGDRRERPAAAVELAEALLEARPVLAHVLAGDLEAHGLHGAGREQLGHAREHLLLRALDVDLDQRDAVEAAGVHVEGLGGDRDPLELVAPVVGGQQVLDRAQRPGHGEPPRREERQLPDRGGSGLGHDLHAVLEPVHRHVVAQELEDVRARLVGHDVAELPHLVGHQQREQADVGPDVDDGVARLDVVLHVGRERGVVGALGQQLRQQRDVGAREQQATAPARADEHATVADVRAVEAGGLGGRRRHGDLDDRLVAGGGDLGPQPEHLGAQPVALAHDRRQLLDGVWEVAGDPAHQPRPRFTSACTGPHGTGAGASPAVSPS
jgi:hypothetical protein